MSGWKSRAEVETIKKAYPIGSMIELDYMNEAGMPPGLKGTIKRIDDQGQLHMSWENGRSLALVPGEDEFHMIPALQAEKDQQRVARTEDREEFKRGSKHSKKNPLPFTEDQMRQVFETNIIDFAVQHGFEVEKGDRNTVHVKQSGGLFLFKNGRGFHCFTGDKKGNIIEFAKEYLGAADFKEAVEMILGCRAYEMTEHYVPPVEKKERGELILPPKDKTFMPTIEYLTGVRGLDDEIVAAMIKAGKIYGARTESNGRVFHNCAFVGFDETGKARYCALRAPSETSKFRQDVEHSDKTYGFTMEGTSNRVYEFEAPIDAMSHATLCKFHGIDWREDHRVSEGCLSDKTLQRYLQNHPEIEEIVFCYDNDVDGKLPDGSPHNHGQVKAEEYAVIYQERGYRVFIQTPKGKDFNQDLLTYRAMILEQDDVRDANKLDREAVE